MAEPKKKRKSTDDKLLELLKERLQVKVNVKKDNAYGRKIYVAVQLLLDGEVLSEDKDWL